MKTPRPYLPPEDLPAPNSQPQPRGKLVSRIAHALGQRASRGEAAAESDAHLRSQELVSAWELACGINKQLFSLLDLLADIPRAGNANILRPYEVKEHQGSSLMWDGLRVVSSPNTTGLERGGFSPLVGAPLLGRLHIDGPAFPHNGYFVDITSLAVSLQAHRSAAGAFEGVTAELVFNQHTENTPVLTRLPHHRAVHVVVGSQGTITEIGISGEKTTGYDVIFRAPDAQPSIENKRPQRSGTPHEQIGTNLPQVLNTIQGHIADTAALYKKSVFAAENLIEGDS